MRVPASGERVIRAANASAGQPRAASAPGDSIKCHHEELAADGVEYAEENGLPDLQAVCV